MRNLFQKFLDLKVRFYKLFVCCGNAVQPLVLLAFRLFWGYQFFLSGKGKLINHETVVGFFTNLGIPAPGLNAWFIGGLETAGGILLMLGLCSRPIALMMIGNMIVAYLTADRDAVMNIFNDPDAFFAATPFLFLVMSVLVFAFGPGAISVDAWLKRRFFDKDLKTQIRKLD